MLIFSFSWETSVDNDNLTFVCLLQAIVTQSVEDCGEWGQLKSELHLRKVLEDVASYSQVDF